MLWEDHRNDLFINSFGEILASLVPDRTLMPLCAGLLMSAGGSKLAWCMLSILESCVQAFSNTRNLDLDPLGAIVVSNMSQQVA